MYARWAAELYGQQQANGIAEEASRISARGGADAPDARTPVSTCESFADGVAC